MFSATAHKAFAQSLVHECTAATHFPDGPELDLGDFPTDGRLLSGPVPSRLPARGQLARPMCSAS
eukprot:276734-Karenia_brevis.AAC.1